MRPSIGAVLALVLAAAPGLDAQRPAARRCALELIRADREGGGDQMMLGNTNYYAGGNVKLRCARQQVFLDGDSVASIGGQFIQVITRAEYRDEDVTISADTLTYRKPRE